MSAAVLSLPPLRHGERLGREEFERRYEAMPDVKAELLEGVVYLMSSPVSAAHSDPHGDLMCWIAFYKAYTPGTASGDNGTMRFPEGSNPQPDVHLRILEEHGGQSYIDDDGYISGVPDLLGEVAKSSLSYDLTIKKPLFQRDGVREYILWRVEERAIDWWVLRNGKYDLFTRGSNEIVRSETFPGLWLDLEAMVQRDLGSVLRALQKGVDSPEHAKFVESLRKARQSKP